MRRRDVPSIGELTAFIAASQHGSFTRAARDLDVTQGALSRQIRSLESRLGTILFERIRQRVVLTDVGRLYAARVEKALNDLAMATGEVVSYSDQTTLKVTAMPTFATRWLIPRLLDFQQKNPKTTIRLIPCQHPIDFASEQFDAAIFYESLNWTESESYHLMDVDVVPVCSPKLDAKKPIKSPTDVAGFPLLHHTARPTRWAEWISEAGIKLEKPLRGSSYDHFSMIAQAAIAGLGIGLLPIIMVEDELASKKLKIASARALATKTSYHLMIPEAKSSSPPLRAFTKWLLDQAQMTDTAKTTKIRIKATRSRRK